MWASHKVTAAATSRARGALLTWTLPSRVSNPKESCYPKRRRRHCFVSLRAARKLGRVLIPGQCCNFECLRHHGVDVEKVDEIVNRRPEVEGHCGLVNDLARVVPDHRDAQDLIGVGVSHHLDDAPRLA